MDKCEKCGAELTDNCFVVWKCNECGKGYKLNLGKLRMIQERKMQNAGKSLLKCKDCGFPMDDGDEKIVCKCASCGNVSGGNLAYIAGGRENTDNSKEINIEKQNDVIKCPKCGKTLPRNSVYCLECGKKVNRGLQNDTRDLSKRQFNSKVVLLSTFTLLAVCIGIGYISYASQPTVKYKRAEEAVSKQNYDRAIDLYTDLDEYLDSADKLATTILLKHYFDGCELYECGEYDSAIEELEQAVQDENTQEMMNKAYYGKAIELLESKNYVEAASAFKNSNWYGDSDEKILEIGKMIVEDGDYDMALTVFNSGRNLQGNEYAQYAQGMLNFQNRNYNEASMNFSRAGNLFDSEEKYKESSYQYAEKQIEEGNYNNARTIYAQIQGYKDSEEMINACDLMLAKEEMKNGDLGKALNTLEKLPEAYSYDNIVVSELLNKLNNNSQWVSACGKWKSTKGLAEAASYHRRTGSEMGSWTHTIEINDYTLDIKCSINNDETITVSGSGTLFEFTDWSTIKNGLKYNVNKSISFSKTIDASSFGKTIEMDENITVTFLDNKVVLKYVVNDNNSTAYFTYRYETNITYEK
ncbi:MAG: hypothetical protein K2O65_14195 [Lachnospiraceae bacterium]|nr:hypothetical protein [Lachnospiraceae bacterium]